MANNNKGQSSLTVLRVVLGIIFIAHGYVKLFVPNGFSGFVGLLTAIKIPLPLYAGILVSILEFAGGILLFIGLFSRWTSVFLIIEMLVTLFRVHLKNGFFISQQSYGYEFNLLILGVLLAILFGGPGALSLGKNYFKSKHLH